MRRKWRMWLYNTVVFTCIGGVLTTWIVALANAARNFSPGGDVLVQAWLLRAVWISLGAIGFHVLFYLWWLWQLARLARSLGDTRAHAYAFEQLLNMKKHGVSAFMRVLSLPELQWKGREGVTWDARLARRLAAEGLGRLKDPEAVAPLSEVVDDPDVGLQGKAAWALGEIGDARAVAALVPLLGEAQSVADDRARAADRRFGEAIARSLQDLEDQPLGEVADAALRKLGAGDLASAFREMLEGHTSALKAKMMQSRRLVVDGLRKMLDSREPATAVKAAHAAEALDVVEALPELRSKLRVFSGADRELKEACEQAIEKLQGMAALPRAAESPAPPVETLPRTAETGREDVDLLPRVSEQERSPDQQAA